MCKYCEFDYKEEPFTTKEIWRGDLFLYELDSDIYIERECLFFKEKRYYDYYLTSQTLDKKTIMDEINFCPKCGKKLPLNK